MIDETLKKRVIEDVTLLKIGRGSNQSLSTEEGKKSAGGWRRLESSLRLSTDFA